MIFYLFFCPRARIYGVDFATPRGVAGIDRPAAGRYTHHLKPSWGTRTWRSRFAGSLAGRRRSRSPSRVAPAWTVYAKAVLRGEPAVLGQHGIDHYANADRPANRARLARTRLPRTCACLLGVSQAARPGPSTCWFWRAASLAGC